jgi:hypothetical protein
LIYDISKLAKSNRKWVAGVVCLLKKIVDLIVWRFLLAAIIETCLLFSTFVNHNLIVKFLDTCLSANRKDLRESLYY